MYLRIFRYTVKPELRDRHLGVQARAAKLYARYVRLPPAYFRGAKNANQWVELHTYSDRQECQSVAQSIAADPELASLWKEFQETLDPGFPATIEELNEYELPATVNSSPFSQPPIDSQPPVAPRNNTPAEPPVATPHMDSLPAADHEADVVADEVAEAEVAELAKSFEEPQNTELPEIRGEVVEPTGEEIRVPDEDTTVERPLSFGDGVWELPPEKRE